MYKISITIEIVSLFAVKQMHVHWQYLLLESYSCKKFINHLLPFYIDLSSRKFLNVLRPFLPYIFTAIQWNLLANTKYPVWHIEVAKGR